MFPSSRSNRRGVLVQSLLTLWSGLALAYPGSALGWEKLSVRDFNQDGTLDSLLLEDESTCGNAGCFFSLRISHARQGFDTATLFLHPKAFRVDKDRKGENVVQYYIRENSDSGFLYSYRLIHPPSHSPHNSPEKRIIHPTGKDSVLYNGLFHTPSAKSALGPSPAGSKVPPK